MFNMSTNIRTLYTLSCIISNTASSDLYNKNLRPEQTRLVKVWRGCVPAVVYTTQTGTITAILYAELIYLLINVCVFIHQCVCLDYAFGRSALLIGLSRFV